jgi:pyruvate kinase
MKGPDSVHVHRLIDQISSLRSGLLGLERDCASQWSELSPAGAASARNLMHYLALRGHDIRDLQEQLAALGLSSLGRAESGVLANLDAVLRLLRHMAQGSLSLNDVPEAAIGMKEGKVLLKRRTEELLGPKPEHRSVRIMVTMPREAAHDYKLVRDALIRGMDCMRINCAHDDRTIWAGMIAQLRQAEKETEKRCRILMDVAGPKLRTGPLELGPRVVKWRPQRDCLGQVTRPARIWLMPRDHLTLPPAPADVCLHVTNDWLARLSVGEHVKFRDARGAKRAFQVVEAIGDCRWVESEQTAYVTPGTRLQMEDNKGSHRAMDGLVGELPGVVIPLVLRVGDTLILSRSLQPGRPSSRDDQGRLQHPAQIGCTLPEVFADLRPGHTIWFDDGKIGGIIREVMPNHARVEITYASPAGDKLGPDKGINLPDTDLHLPALTEEDIKNLDFIANHADLVGFSFVHSAAGVAELQQRLAERNGQRLGIVLKIESARAFEHLPELLLTALRSNSVGVMIARGDLAVECGYERLAELQEEILWVCEATHVPVIWATQVLENLAKTGMPSRAEVTDAAMGERAECVMLNKGPHILDAVRVLDDILRRMEGHQSKKRPLLRRLHLTDHFRATVKQA